MSHHSSTSMRLLEQARSGDAESLGLLLRKYFRYLNSLSHGHIDDRIRLRVSASDVVQETLLEAHRDFQNFVGTSLEEFTGWLRRILFNNLASAIESHVFAAKRDVRKQRSLDEKQFDRSGAGLEGLIKGDFTSPSASLRQHESLNQLAVAIGNLPSSYRRVIKLRHYEGLPFAEIALRIGRKPGATRMLWVRAVAMLKNEMSNNE